MFSAIPDPLARLTVIAEVEFQGRTLSAQLLIDGAVWNRSAEIQEEVKRQLKQHLADEIVKHLDPEFTIVT